MSLVLTIIETIAKIIGLFILNFTTLTVLRSLYYKHIKKMEAPTYFRVTITPK